METKDKKPKSILMAIMYAYPNEFEQISYCMHCLIRWLTKCEKEATLSAHLIIGRRIKCIIGDALLCVQRLRTRFQSNLQDFNGIQLCYDECMSGLDYMKHNNGPQEKQFLIDDEKEVSKHLELRQNTVYSI